MPDPRPVAPRTDSGAADMQALVQLGYAPPQPIPQASPKTPEPAPPPDPVDEQEAATLSAALADAGVETTAEDQAAVQALVRLDPATVEAVTRWVKAKKTKPDATPST
jgi:type II secretory pathway component PulM